MFVSYYRIENRSSCHILEPILCEPPYEVFYRPHLTLTAACSQVSGSPSARRTVVGCGSPRVVLWVQWKHTHKPSPLAPELPRPFPSDYTKLMLCLSLGDQPMCQTEQILFFNQSNSDLLHYCLSAKHKGICNFSVFLLLDLKRKWKSLLRFAVRTPYWYQLFHYLK